MLSTFIPQVIELTIDPRILWITFILLIIIVYSVLSAILFYHWHEYSQAPEQMSTIVTYYFSVSAIFITLSLGALIIFSLS